MKGAGKRFDYIKGNIFEIPFFQRPYVWEEKNWKQLIESIDEELGNNFPYLGSIIVKRNTEDDPWLVIDGQQRLTTLSILIKAFIDVYSPHINDRIKTQYEDIIYNVISDGMDNVIYKPRIIPSSVDKEEYESVIDYNNPNVKNKTVSITGAYNYFKRDFESRDSDNLKEFGNKILKTRDFIIAIELDKDDDEQKIFNSVNDYGQRLTGADIIKNHLFQVLKTKAGSNIDDVLETYKKYWDKVFYQNDRKDFWYKERTYGRITQINLEEFLKDYALIKGFYRTANKNSLSESYRVVINSYISYEEVKNFIKDLAKYAESFYEMISDYDAENDFRITENIDTTLLILNQLECTTFIPVILKIYNEPIENKDKYLFEIQKFILERLIYNLSNKNYNKNVEILLDKKTTDEAIQYLHKVNEDDDYDLGNYPPGLANINNQRATVILFLIEMIRRNNYGEEKFSDTLMFNKTLEHVMPQKWEKNWRNVSCFDYDANGDYVEITNIDDMRIVRKKSIYSIGNMTLLSGPLNSSISNSSFEEKMVGKEVRKKQKEGIKKFVGSLLVAKDIIDEYDEQTKEEKNHVWNEKQINDRSELLFKELNSHYLFTNNYETSHTPILKKNFDKANLDMNNVLETITDDFLNEKRIAVVVTETMKHLFKNNKLSNEEILNLQNKEYCSNTFACWMPMLSTNPSKPERYYKDKVQYNGFEYFVTKEWAEKNRDKFVTWYKTQLNK